MAILQAIEVLEGWLPLVGAAFVALVGAIALHAFLRWWGSDALSRIPLYGRHLGDEDAQRATFLSRSSSLYLEGYRKFKDGAFRLTTTKSVPVVVIAPKFLPELQKLPDSIISFPAAISELMHVKYTSMSIGSDDLTHTIKASLTPALVRLNATLQREVAYACESELGACADWTEVNVHSKLLRIVAMASGRIFIGPELSRREEYLQPAINYTVDLMNAVRAISQLKPWQRPLYGPRLGEIKILRRHQQEAVAFLRPVVRARIAAQMERGGGTSGSGSGGSSDSSGGSSDSSGSSAKPDDMLQWFVDRMEAAGTLDELELARNQLILSFAAIHTTTTTTTNALYTLAAMPEIIPDLRREIISVLGQHNGEWTSAALQSMKKLDSFMRENMRFYPLGPGSFLRKVLRPFTLSNGQQIPAGVLIEIPAVVVNNDAGIWTDADRFDPWRYSDLREAAAQEAGAGGVAAGGGGGGGGTRAAETAARNQVVSVNTQHLTFGFGRHACPGRFFAANEIKMILANVVLRYEIGLAGGAVGRYPNIEFAEQAVPDPNRVLLLKRA